MLMCPYCISELKNKGKNVFIGYQEMDFEESMKTDTPCEWCDEYDELYEVKLFDNQVLNNTNNQLLQYYKIKIRNGFSNEYNYLSYPLQGMLNYSFYAGYNSNKYGIIVSEEAMKRDILQLYLAYHDYELEKVDIVNLRINNKLIFKTESDFGDVNLLLIKRSQSPNGYYISASEKEYIDGKFNNCKYYKLKTKDGWIGKNLKIVNNPDCCMVFSDYAILNDDLNSIISKYDYEIVCVKIPCHFGKIFYNQKDIQVYIDRIN